MKELVLIFENSLGTLTMGSNQDIKINYIDGLVASEYVIHTKESALLDGCLITGKQIKERTIKIIFTIDDYNLTAELRDKILRFFNPKISLNLKIKYWHKQAFIDCEVESLSEYEYENFNDLLSFEITLKCANPFFKSIDNFGKDIAESKPMFSYPLVYSKKGTRRHEINKIFSYKTFNDTVRLKNDGDVEIGLTIELIASGNVVKPKIINKLNNEFIELNFTMQRNDKIIISTISGNKKILLHRNNQITNISNNINKLSTYFQLKLDENVIGYTAESGKNNLAVIISFNKAYLGI